PLRSFPLSFFHRPAPPLTYTLSLHDALPISHGADRGLILVRFEHADEAGVAAERAHDVELRPLGLARQTRPFHLQERAVEVLRRSEEHTSELQSRGHLVCRLLLEKKKHTYNN